MRARTRVLSAAAAAGLCAAAAAPVMRAQQPTSASSARSTRAHPDGVQPAGVVTPSAVNGIVVDEQNRPLAGATVSVLGAAAAMTLTDATGRFALRELPPGDYSVRAHLAGFAASPRERIRLGAPLAPAFTLRMARLEIPVATTGLGQPLAARPIIAAGFALPGVEAEPAEPAAEGADHSHTDTAWRLRHLTRSVLKDSANAVVVAPEEPGDPAASVKPTPSFASALFADLPFSGEVNLLTSSAFGTRELSAGPGLPRGIAYLSIGAPTPAGSWTARAAMSQGDLSSWVVAGSFLSRRDSMHSYDVGLSYSTQEYQGGNPLALAAVTDGSRNVGEVSVIDRWKVTPAVSFEYGGRYARYDYLARPGLFSPRAGFTLEPVPGTRVSALLVQRMVAPGADEFLSPGLAGPWLPPERTFSPLAGRDLRVERARALDVLFEHEFGTSYMIGVRRFFQGITDQTLTVFGMRMPAGPQSVGHYYVASAGNVDAQGWGVKLGTAGTKRLRGSVEYSVAHGRWSSRGDAETTRPWVASLARPELEDMHDVTASFSTDIPETATRVFVLYKVNTAFARPGANLAEAGADGRFDVQLNQALPFVIGGTRWEVLVGVRNLFRDPASPASVYDELLVVSPPKRVVGGFLVRF